jgi:hypothetical protein
VGTAIAFLGGLGFADRRTSRAPCVPRGRARSPDAGAGSNRAHHVETAGVGSRHLSVETRWKFSDEPAGRVCRNLTQREAFEVIHAGTAYRYGWESQNEILGIFWPRHSHSISMGEPVVVWPPVN